MAFTKVYDSGLKLIINKLDGMLSVATGIFVKTGSVNETTENNGISHFIEHMMFKGTKKRTAFQISDDIDSIGSNINAFTSKEMTVYHTVSTYEHQEETFEILSDIFLNSTFLPEEIEKERGVIIEEINMTEDTPDEVCLDNLSNAFYGNTGLGMTILGPIENIKKFKREDFIDYISSRYLPENVVISVCGAVDIDKTVEMVDKYFANFVGDFHDTVPTKNQPTFAKSVAKSKDIEQVHIAIAFPSFAFGDKRNPCINIANSILGGGMSSRLFQKVREELGLCYTVYSYPSAYLNNGRFEIYAGVNPSKAQDALDAIVNEVEILKKDGITEKEFLRGKEQMKSAFILSQESTASQMRLFGRSYLLLDEVYDSKKKIEEYNALTIDEVNAVIKEIFDFSKASISIVGRKVKALEIIKND